jgi:serine/threonine protein kinase
MVNGDTHDIGRQLGNYRLIELLGQGGFADVYLGEQTYLKTLAAIKVLRTHLSDDALQQFIGEARTIARLVHPHIITVLDFGIDNGVPFLVMPYARQGSLRKLHRRGQKLPPPTVASYVRQVAQALQYAHDNKIIHRDVKPENMLLGDDNLLKLSDFGIATASHSTYTRPTRNPQDHPVGTTTYMAPEQFVSEPSLFSDQYALSVVVYEWLCGTPPFTGTDMEISFHHVHAPVPSLLSKAPQLSPAIDAVMQCALAKDPRARFPRILDFANALAAACATSSLNFSSTPQMNISLYLEGQPRTFYDYSASTVANITSTPNNQFAPRSQMEFPPVPPGSHPGFVPSPSPASYGQQSLPGLHAASWQVSTPSPVYTKRTISRRTLIAGGAGLTVAAALGVVATGVWPGSSRHSASVVSAQQHPTPAPTQPPVTPTLVPTPAAIISTTRPTVASWGVGQFDLFVRGTDNALWQRHYDGALHDWAAATSPLSYDPTMISWGPSRFDVFVRGPDNALQHGWFDGSWHVWEVLGGALQADAAAASWGPGRLDAFIHNSDHALWHIYFDGSWHAWESLGGVLTSSPTAVATKVNVIDVFVRGVDNGLWVKQFDGAWHDWQPLGGSLTSDPVVVSWGAGRLDVFARGAENTLQHIWFDGSWHAWESLGGSIASAPTAVAWGPNRIDVFARGFDNSLQHSWLDGSWHPWQPLG